MLLPRATRPHPSLVPRNAIRAFTTPPAAMAAQPPTFSQGADPSALTPLLAPLLAPGRWSLTNEGGGLERPFRFTTFAKTWDFMTAVSLQCKFKNHHPEWSNVYNTTFIRWTTHEPKGLSAKDVTLATLCDELARDFGEVVEDASAAKETQSCALGGLADAAVAAGGDCCVPKK
ncbi:uncharacterized protein VDAG_08932 [Verticillium dahliae VdLs.17]|uniref:4a-hydroxytetrahydrobiopterin dehydratase n=1 Tax=Verticillium dahliae (strain VdLs.17 / ATCC MYA-4575 / FGSC 10137) TaxID=498257 RepID=G2XGE5_VERDV|nr:uncharacterized protein VDAG_08932 [Verticillium dahliae VdLs.17]EGY18772.1 hypothetical protein VDAG_08932 [Verticillium dahliae VdLs.17]